MTKIIIIGNCSKKEKNLTPIEFISCIDSNFKIKPTSLTPHDFNFIELICLNYSDEKDLMFAYNYNHSRQHGSLLIGLFNDGVV